ncbi:MAG TPA: hypothetical protein VKU38_02000 [Ktedonobacteraceae bacterium]|nr:hypothetical protein [Ktedonobacteraceae bacterium]
MSVETKSYDIYDLKTGQLAARISAEGIVKSVGDTEAVVALQKLMQREIVILEHQIDVDPQNTEEEYEPYPEENMCYFGMVTLRPDDPSYFKAFLRRLPYISFYEARPSNE